MAWWRRADEALDGQEPESLTDAEAGSDTLAAGGATSADEPTPSTAPGVGTSPVVTPGDHSLPWGTVPIRPGSLTGPQPTLATPATEPTPVIPPTTVDDDALTRAVPLPVLDVEPRREVTAAPETAPTPETPVATSAAPDHALVAQAAQNEQETPVADFQTTLNEAMQIDGALGVALVDSTSGMALATAGSPVGLDLNIAAAGNSSVIQAKLRTIRDLGLNEDIEDILITLASQYHIIRTFGAEENMFLYLVLDKSRANLAMARFRLAKIEKELQL